MSNISADFVLRHLLARIEWAAGQGAEYVIEGYDQELIRNALGVSPPPVLPNPPVQPVSYYDLMDGDTVLEGDEVLLNDRWRDVFRWMIGGKRPSVFPIRRPIPAHCQICDPMQYYYLVRGDLIEQGDQIYTKSGWKDCHLVGARRILADIRRPLVGCPYPGHEYVVYPNGYFVGKELKEDDAAWDGHNWLLLQSVIDNHGYIDVVLKNSFVRRKKIHL